MTSKVFITGATGYIGGEALYQLLNCSKNYEITALVRSEEKAEKLKKATGNKVQTVIGQLDDLELIEEQVRASDIIINTANVDHVPSAEVLRKALTAKKEPTILIHTSGTSVLGEPLDANKKPTLKVWSDEKDIDEINSIRDDAPHRPVDKLILEIQEKNPQVKTAVICPSLIFGISHGYDKVNSVQIPELIKASVKNDGPFSVYSGEAIWSHIHIHDLGELYKVVLDKLVAGESIPQGREGYYFGSLALKNEPTPTEEPTEVEHLWRKLSEKVGEVLYKRKLVKTDKVQELQPDPIVQLKDGDVFAPYYWGTNSRSRGDNGYKIGWKPKYTTLNQFWDAVEQDLDHLIKIGQVKESK
ncbi:hypothetical protein PGUG_04889 [Meyerozyma guilliermondii ATCC 6260]|uniref:NmrA-like domain-containing protein n=1 Tax=Meyerozyma guilliermondii (strain ATCC 6260 / CBS 566 / DSM 6381 / JCM 1539 / NBRC 10279 / NRRL Y-324) TaxID=294746 RepID=A5DNN8_PICGU|nr:uncharacterized protein PGUG_04889 [Meyerozyma guilliermondii ATCC 6260]EDK40792.2 hypothetical protein PGUG_04889 [Meyerozyma guilliermondii ATCC 6260]